MPDARLDAPMPPATFFVLFALAGGDKHGYAQSWRKRVSSLNNGFGWDQPLCTPPF